MKQWHVILSGMVLAVISAVAGYQFQQYQNKTKEKDVNQDVTINSPLTPEQVIGTKLGDFRLFDVDGQQRSLSEWQGKALVLNFWATWCTPCRKEIPAFIELQQQYRNNGIQFIGIALQEAEEIRDFLVEFGVNYPALVGVSDVIKVAKQLGNDIGALPYTVFVDRDGTIVFSHRGPLLKSDAEEMIKTIL